MAIRTNDRSYASTGPAAPYVGFETGEEQRKERETLKKERIGKKEKVERKRRWKEYKVTRNPQRRCEKLKKRRDIINVQSQPSRRALAT